MLSLRIAPPLSILLFIIFYLSALTMFPYVLNRSSLLIKALLITLITISLSLNSNAIFLSAR